MKKVILFMLFLFLIPVYQTTEQSYTTTLTLKYYSGTYSNYLSNVSFQNIEFHFNKDTLSYEIDVPYSKSTLGLTYTAEDSKAIVEVIGGEELHVGNNSLVIIVTAVDGSVREYDFTINRREDNSSVSNNINDILDILEDESSNITVNVDGENAVSLYGDALNALQQSKKILTYTWNDRNGNFIASLKIDSMKITNDQTINPNLSKKINNKKLLEFLGNTPHIEISTVNSNLPKNSVYSMKVTGSDDLYYLYYYDGDIFNTKPLRNIDGVIEFEIEDGIDYAIVSESKKPINEVSGFSWLVPSLIATVFIVIFVIISRKIMIKSVKDKYSGSHELDSEENHE